MNKKVHREASLKLNVFASDAHYLNLAQRRLIMNPFIFQVWILPADVDIE